MVDSHGQSLAYVYGHADKREAETAKGLTLDEARRIAANIAKLPKLARRGKSTPKTEQEKRAYLAHLNYEVWMLKHSYERIANRPKEPADCNAFIECFAVHARALFEFLTNKPHRNQNALARDFIGSFVPSGDAECVSTIIDKIQDQILHTGWTRGEAHTIKFTGEDIIKVREWIDASLKEFATQLTPENRPALPATERVREVEIVALPFVGFWTVDPKTDVSTTAPKQGNVATVLIEDQPSQMRAARPSRRKPSPRAD